MSDVEYRALENSLASVKMEGFPVTEHTMQDCIRLFNGDITIPELVEEITNRMRGAS